MDQNECLVRRRRGQKQRDVQDERNPQAKVSSDGSRAEALACIRRLDRAKRRLRSFNKAALCVAALYVGNSVYTILSRRRGGGGASAFQSAKINVMKRINSRHWPLFGNQKDSSEHDIPKEMLQAFGSYPNLLNISDEMRGAFHPVVKLPPRTNVHSAEGGSMRVKFDYTVKDFTGSTESDKTVLLEDGTRVPQLAATIEEAIELSSNPKKSKQFDVGRYDENRAGMYTSSLFEVGDEKDRRTIHIGVDIGAPVGTSVYAFEDGVVHSAGYNPALGDYGHVVVIEHHIKNEEAGETTKVYALYGHLSRESIHGKHQGKTIEKGEILGTMGNTAENGGWTGMCTQLTCRRALELLFAHVSYLGFPCLFSLR